MADSRSNCICVINQSINQWPKTILYQKKVPELDPTHSKYPLLKITQNRGLKWASVRGIVTLSWRRRCAGTVLLNRAFDTYNFFRLWWTFVRFPRRRRLGSSAIGRLGKLRFPIRSLGRFRFRFAIGGANQVEQSVFIDDFCLEFFRLFREKKQSFTPIHPPNNIVIEHQRTFFILDSPGSVPTTK